MALTCLVVAGAVAWSLLGKRSESLAKSSSEQMITGSLSSATKGSSGLPIPRFVSLKSEKVNVRRGPSSDHPIAWVFKRKGLPVEIVAEYDNWRRVRHSDGEEGWILQSMLAGKRTVVIAPWGKEGLTPLRSVSDDSSSIVANIASGAMGDVVSCDGKWCQIIAGGYKGYIQQNMLWGVYLGESVE